MRNLILLSMLAVISVGCAMKTKILDATAISMTRTHLNSGEKLKESGPVTGKFCSDTFGDKGTIGLLDESVKAAQAEFKVDYILNASFWQEGSCLSVEGTGATVVAGTPSPMATPEPTPVKKKTHKH